MNSPRLSVIMTVLNGEPYLRLAVDSILSQSFSDFELLVVDDGSSDNTPLVLAEYARRDSRVRLWHNPRNLGLTKSLNPLLTTARAEYVTQHDADDISLPMRFEQQVAYLDANRDVGLVACQVQLIDEAGELQAGDPFHSGLDNDSIQATLLHHNCLCAGSVFFRRALQQRVGLYDDATLDHAPDYDLWLRLAEITRIAKLPNVLYQYRTHSQTMTHTRRSLQALHQARTLENAVYRRFGPQPPADRLAHVARQYLASVELECKQGNLPAALASLARAIQLSPAMIASADTYIATPDGNAGLEFLKSAFADAPPTMAVRHARAKVLARWHMQRVFAAPKHDKQQAHAHLVPALQSDPSWLFNRGVALRLVRMLFAR